MLQYQLKQFLRARSFASCETLPVDALYLCSVRVNKFCGIHQKFFLNCGALPTIKVLHLPSDYFNARRFAIRSDVLL